MTTYADQPAPGAPLPTFVLSPGWVCGRLLLGAIVCLLFCGSADGQVSGSDEPSVTLEEFIEMILVGDYEDAADLREEVPASPERTLWHARLLRETGRGTEALALLSDSAEFKAGNLRFLTAAAGLNSEVGDWTVARTQLEQVVAKKPSVEALTRLGLLMISMGEADKGKAELEKVLGIYKALSAKEAREVSADDYVWMGKACEGLNRHRDAYGVMYSSAFDVDPDSARAHVASGHVLLAKYNYPDARSHFKDAIKANGALAEAHVGLAYSTYVDYQYPRNRYLDTARALKAAERVWPNHPDASVLYGHLAFFDENWAEAEKQYTKAATLQPRNLEYRAYVGVLYYATYQLEKLAALEKEIAELHPKPAEFYGTMAAKMVDRFFYEEAATFARRAVEIDPKYWPAYVTLGVNALRAGDDVEGKKYIEKAFQNDKFNIWAYNTRVLIRHIDKNFIEDKTEDFTFRFHKDDRDFLLPYLQPLMEDAKERMESQYRVVISKPITFEDFSKHTYFSARSIGLPGLAASGVCFGKMVTLTTPKAIPGNWGAVAIHEFAHVIALHKAKQRVPRWFTEGLSVFEEGREHPGWTRHFADEFCEAVFHDGLLPMSRLQSGFTKPDTPNRILLSYYQGGVICRYIDETYGFDKIVAMLSAYGKGKLTEQIFPEVLGVSLDEFDKGFFAYAREFAESLGLQPRIPLARVDALKFKVEDDPDDLDAIVELAFGYFFNGKEADAELTLGKAFQLEKEHPDMETLLGLLKMGQGKTKAAGDHLKKALELKTKYQYRAHLALGMIRLARNDNDGAIQLLQKAIEIHPTGTRPRFGAEQNPHYLLINTLQAEDREPEALEAMQRLATIDRDDVVVRKELLAYFVGQEKWSKAVEFGWDAVYIDPYDPEIHDFLAKAYLGMNRWDSCRRELEVLMALPEPPVDRVYPDLAWCYHKLGNSEKARNFAQRAIDLGENDSRLQEILAPDNR